VSELLQNASYDQIVLSICVAAVVVTGALMHLTFHIGNVNRQRRTESTRRNRPIKLSRSAEGIDHKKAA